MLRYCIYKPPYFFNIGLSGDEFHFDPNGDGPARYNIIHFKETAPGEYKWVRVGEYLEGELHINKSRKFFVSSVFLSKVIELVFHYFWGKVFVTDGAKTAACGFLVDLSAK